MLPQTYRKLVATKYSTDFRDATRIIEVPMPEPSPTQVIVRNLFSGINASDPMRTAGAYPGTPQPPFDPGAEATGEVVAVGSDVTTHKVGDQVMTLGSGGFAEYQVLEAAQAFVIPKATPEITSFMVSALTASIALEQVGRMQSGETVLVTAAAGGTGQFAVQLAKLAGNHVIGTCSSDEKVALLKDLGCDRVINYRKEDLGQVLKAEYRRGVNLVYECVGRETFDTCVNNLARFGRLIIIGYISEYLAGVEKVTAPRIYTQLLFRNASISGFFLPFYPQFFGSHLQRLLGLYAEGKLKANVDATEFRGVDAIPDAVDYLQSGKSAGKVLVRF